MVWVRQTQSSDAERAALAYEFCSGIDNTNICVDELLKHEFIASHSTQMYISSK